MLQRTGNSLRKSRSAPLSPDSIAILPFETIGPDGSDWIGQGIATGLSSALSGGVFLPIDQTSIRSWLDSSEGRGFSGQPLWERVAEKWGADLVLYGDVVTGPGGALEVSAYYFDPQTREGVGPLSVRGALDELLDLIPRLAGMVVGERSGADPSILAELETNSVEALQAFHEGDFEFRAGKYPGAVDLPDGSRRSRSGICHGALQAFSGGPLGLGMGSGPGLCRRCLGF